MNINRILDLAVECNIPPESYFWEWNEYAEWQFRLLNKHMKVQPHHQFLDVGCGAMRLGHLAVPYLDDDHYCGIDAYAPFVEFGQRLMSELGCERTYQLRLSDRLDFEVFERRFDFALAQSVLGHLSQNEIRKCLKSLTRVMKPEGKFYATINFGGRSRQRVGFLYGGRHPFRHPALREISFYEELCSELNIRFEVTDIYHPAQKVAVFHFDGRVDSSLSDTEVIQRCVNAMSPRASTIDEAVEETFQALADYLDKSVDTIKASIDRTTFERVKGEVYDQSRVSSLFDGEGYLIDNAINNLHKLVDPVKARLRLAAAEAVLSEPDGPIMDYGAGAGSLTLLLASLGASEIGVAEVSDRLLDYSRWRLRQYGIEDVETWNLLDESPPKKRYGSVMLIDVFPVIESPNETISLLAKVLKPGGRVVTNLGELPAKGRQKWAYLIGRSPEEIKKIFHDNRFKLERERTFGRHQLCEFRFEAGPHTQSSL